MTTSTMDVLTFAFAPPDNNTRSVTRLITYGLQITIVDSDSLPFPTGRLKSPYDAWGEGAHKLEDSKFKAEWVSFNLIT